MPAVAVYCRISKDSEGRAEGVAAQQKRGRKLAAELWPGARVETFTDNDISAADQNAVRPGFESMLSAIRRGDVDQVVCAEQSRLTRRPAEWEAVVVVLAKAGIGAVHTYRNGAVNVSSSKLLGRILAAVDAEEVERTRARIIDKHETLAAEGRPSGGSSFGYTNATNANGIKTLEIVPEQAKGARWAADAVLAGWSLTNIAAHLEADRVPTRRGGRWTSTTVKSMLLAPTIAGLRVHKGKVVGAGTWDPIIDPDQWRQAKAILTAPAVVQRSDGGTCVVSRRRRPARQYLLTGGIATCGRCGAALIAQQRLSRGGGRRPSYLCHPSRGGCSGIGIGAEGLEQFVADELLDALEQPDFMAAIAATDDGAERRDAAAATIGAVESRQADLARMWAAGDLSAVEWDAARQVLEADRQKAEQDLAVLPPPVHDLDPALVRDGWAGMTLDERRQVVKTFIQSVVINKAKPGTRAFDPGRVEIGWVV